MALTVDESFEEAPEGGNNCAVDLRERFDIEHSAAERASIPDQVIEHTSRNARCNG